MEKALILLKDFEESFKDATIVQEGELERNGIAWILYVREAISELEEAMKPKTCEGCSNLFFDEIEKVYKCSNDVSDDVGYLHGEAVIRNIKDFHCVQHQPKDNA